MENTKSSTKLGRPEFEEILNGFREELDKMNENSDSIMGKISKFQEFRKTSPEACEKQINKEGIIGEFVVCLTRMREYNDNLNEAKNGLEKFVG